MKELLLIIIALSITTGCAVMDKRNTTDLTELPKTLDACIWKLQDFGDSIYNRDVEIRLLKEEIEELKKRK